MSKIILKNDVNIFMDPIYKKSNQFFGIPSKIFLNKTIKFLRSSMPNFALFWQLSDFIKILEKVYFYNNSQNNSLYSSLKFNIGENGFKFKNQDVAITIKLFDESKEIMLEVHRLKGNQLISSMIFNDNSNVELNITDSALLESIIDIVIEEAIYLMTEYYNMKGKRNNGKQ